MILKDTKNKQKLNIKKWNIKVGVIIKHWHLDSDTS